MAATSGKGPPGNKTPNDLGPTTPKDLYPTSDIRLVMVELGKIQSKMDSLGEDNKTHKSDFRLTLGGIISSFFIVMGALIFGHMKLEEKIVDLGKNVVVIGTKMDDMTARPSFPPPGRR